MQPHNAKLDNFSVRMTVEHNFSGVMCCRNIRSQNLNVDRRTVMSFDRQRHMLVVVEQGPRAWRQFGRWNFVKLSEHSDVWIKEPDQRIEFGSPYVVLVS